MRRINPYSLWIGHAGDGRAFREHFERGIRAVVQLAIEEPPLVPPRDMIAFRFPLTDGAGNDPALLRLAILVTAELLRTETATLVCCGGGMSRSPGVVAVAIALAEGSEPTASLSRVTAGGPADVSPSLWIDLRAAQDAAGRFRAN